MKTATISAIPAGEAPGYAWTWRGATDGKTSRSAFAFYFDCVTDARKHGYEVTLTPARGAMAPGGLTYTLAGPGE